jgi:hypothetical protein
VKEKLCTPFKLTGRTEECEIWHSSRLYGEEVHKDKNVLIICRQKDDESIAPLFIGGF